MLGEKGREEKEREKKKREKRGSLEEKTEGRKKTEAETGKRRGGGDSKIPYFFKDWLLDRMYVYFTRES